jgi:regulator of sigma E protease
MPLTLPGIILAIVFVALLILIHEAGHFLAARACRMRVLRFSLGFGPPLLKWERQGIIYQIALIPLGGFVQIAGLNPQPDIDLSDPTIFPNRPVWQRVLTIFAGPFANYAAAFLLVFAYFMVYGMPTNFQPGVAHVVAESPAAKAGLKVRDLFVSVDGRPITSAGQVVTIIRGSGGKAVPIVVRRGHEEVRFEVTPQRQKEGYLIGVIPSDIAMSRRPAGLGESTVAAVRYPVVQTVTTLGYLYLMARGRVAAEFSGPVGIVTEVARSAKSGAEELLQLIAMISVALGLFNLLPMPALDGGRLLFLGYEFVTRRKVRPAIEEAVHMVGFMLLLGLIIIVTFKDIRGCLPHR